jgi:hypothetical protein
VSFKSIGILLGIISLLRDQEVFMERITEVSTYGKKAKGRSEFLRYLKGEKLTRNESILAMCYECLNYYEDGIGDCQASECPLYDYMPYKKK